MATDPVCLITGVKSSSKKIRKGIPGWELMPGLNWKEPPEGIDRITPFSGIINGFLVLAEGTLRNGHGADIV